MGDTEAKLDEDYLFYLTFINTFLRRITDGSLYRKSYVWLYRLCGEPCHSVEMKRCRNIYLSNLLVCMQNGVLDRPFLESPFSVDISNAFEVFGPIPENLEVPDWLQDKEFEPQDTSDKAGQTRTYLATRTLPKGQGAFAYIGISMGEDDAWLAQGQGRLYESELARQYEEQVPPQYEMEKILARRKDPKEREKVLTFYDVLMQCIVDELDGKAFVENATIEGLLEQLIHDLKAQGGYAEYEQLNKHERRTELLMLLYDRVHNRRAKIMKREELLDDIEQKIMPKSFFEDSVQPEDKYEFPAAMWELAINRVPTKRLMDMLQVAYPVPVIQKFLELLSNLKEKIAIRMQKRHETVVAQMRKELRKESESKKKAVDEAKVACDRAESIYKTILEHMKKIKEIEDRNTVEDDIGDPEHTKCYEEMKSTILDTHKLVEAEAEQGRFLAAQIEAVSDHNKEMLNINADVIKNAQQANMKILKNIKKHYAAIKQYETRIQAMQTMQQSQAAGGSTAKSMFIF